ncbi:MAG: hypothetical protein WBB01_18755 [Phormidesmis sp.]
MTPNLTRREPTLVSSTHYCVMGDVTIDESAAIAPGVVLQAAPGSRIVVGRGVCLAAGVCVQSRAGVLTISAGVSLGASVLVVGKGTVGTNACVSPGSTLINPSVAADAILPPDTLIGAQPGSAQRNGYSQPQPSSQSVSAQPKTFKNTFVEPGPIEAKPISIPDLSDQTSTFVPPPLLNQPFNQASGTTGQSHNGSSTNGVQSGYGSSSLTRPTPNNQVSGKSQVNELISALFPSRQPLNDNSSS